MHVLVTGCAGVIGSAVATYLRERGDQVTGLDLEPSSQADRSLIGDVADAEAVLEAVRGVDAVIHLAAVVRDAPLEQLVGPNLLGPYYVLEAAVQAGVKRVALASSVQVVSRRHRRLLAEDRSPGNRYAATKCFLEDLAQVYHRRHDLEVISVRIGFVVRNETEAERMLTGNHQQIYLSRDDAARCFHAAVHARFEGCPVIYAVGPAGAEAFDLEGAREAIGFVPRDHWPDGLGFDLPESLAAGSGLGEKAR